ncbi:MAG TPA: hypothetical protein VE547_12005, partial [Mycobacteriales bacterium]|nr:hypothetical protein [Mycobacteriales bacterium]
TGAGGSAPGVDLPAGTGAGGSAPGVDLAGGRAPGSVGEPGVDLPGGQLADAEDTGAALAAAAAGREPGSVGEPGVDLPAGLAAGVEAVGEALAAGHPADATADATDLGGAGGSGAPDPRDPTAGLDGYLAVDPPIPNYDELSIPQLRGRLRSLTERQLEDLVAYERSTAARPPYLTMLENRLVTVRAR